jgi:hypothetical protein
MKLLVCSEAEGNATKKQRYCDFSDPNQQYSLPLCVSTVSRDYSQVSDNSTTIIQRSRRHARGRFGRAGETFGAVAAAAAAVDAASGRQTHHIYVQHHQNAAQKHRFATRDPKTIPRLGHWHLTDYNRISKRWVPPWTRVERQTQRHTSTREYIDTGTANVGNASNMGATLMR